MIENKIQYFCVYYLLKTKFWQDTDYYVTFVK